MDGVLISFLHIFNVGGKPGMNLSNACETTFPGLQLLNCPAIGAGNIYTYNPKVILT